MKRSNLFPTISELLASPSIKPWVDRLQPAAVTAVAYGVLQEMYDEARSVATEFRMPDFSELTARIIARLDEREAECPIPPINATGIFFHPLYGFPPAPPRIVEQVLASLGTPTPTEPVDTLLRELIGAEDALVFSTFAAIPLALVECFGQGRPFAISHHDVFTQTCGLSNVRIYRSFDHSAEHLRFVGSVNGTTSRDYIEALQSDNLGAVLFARAACNAFEPALGTTELAEVLAVADEQDIPAILELEFVTIPDLTTFGHSLPHAASCLAEGFDLLIFRGDRLIGGPEVGIVAGRKSLVEKLRNSVYFKAFRPSSIGLASLRTILELYHGKEHEAFTTIPILERLATPLDNLKDRVQRMAAQLVSSNVVAEIRQENRPARLLPETPMELLSAPTIIIEPKRLSAKELQEKLLERPYAIAMGRSTDSSHLEIFLQSVPPHSDLQIIEAFQQIGK